MVIIRTKEQLDKEEFEELQKLASKGITDDELEDVVAEFQEQDKKTVDASASYEILRERYKQEKARENFFSGKGGFKRASE